MNVIGQVPRSWQPGRTSFWTGVSRLAAGGGAMHAGSAWQVEGRTELGSAISDGQDWLLAPTVAG